MLWPGHMRQCHEPLSHRTRRQLNAPHKWHSIQSFHVIQLFHVFPAGLALIEPLAPVSLARWSTLTSPTLPCQWHWGPAGSLGAGTSRPRAGHQRIWWSCWGDSRHLYRTPALATWTCSMWHCRTWLHWNGSVWKLRGEKTTNIYCYLYCFSIIFPIEMQFLWYLDPPPFKSVFYPIIL